MSPIQLGPKLLRNGPNLGTSCAALEPSWAEVVANSSKLGRSWAAPSVQAGFMYDVSVFDQCDSRTAVLLISAQDKCYVSMI